MNQSLLLVQERALTKAEKSVLCKIIAKRDHAKNFRLRPWRRNVTRNASDWRLYSPQRIRSRSKGKLAP